MAQRGEDAEDAEGVNAAVAVNDDDEHGEHEHQRDHEPTQVYVRDDAYSWLPARLISTCRSSSSKPPTATVVLTLPDDWTENTVLPSASASASSPAGGKRIGRGVGGSKSPGGGGGSTSDATTMGVVRSGQERTVNLTDYPNETLPRANVDPITGKPLFKSDMADLPYLHEAAILYNVKDAHARGVPYTRVNDIVVAMNPFQWIDGLYSEEKQAFYADKLIWHVPSGVDVAEDDNPSTSDAHLLHDLEAMFGKAGLDPHVYETSSLAYRGLALDGGNQAILVSGESGAGKTETVKLLMSHLAMMQGSSSASASSSSVASSSKRTTSEGKKSPRSVTQQSLRGDEHELDGSGSSAGGEGKRHQDVVTKVLESNSIFEAFGNARTARNDNSSRFGKFTELQFELDDGAAGAGAGGHFDDGDNDGGVVVPRCRLVGSNSETYLLEKSRVVGHHAGERTYHIFYQLLSAPEVHRAEVWEGLVDADPYAYKYVYHDETHVDEDCAEDGENWYHTVTDLALFGIKGDDLATLMRALCVVMQLGNLTFGPDRDNEERTLVASDDELDRLADLMGLPGDEIAAALTTRSMSARSESFDVFLSPTASKDGCDALAKEMYAQIFERIVRTLNGATRADGGGGGGGGGATTDSSSRRGPGGGSGRNRKYATVSLLDLFGFESFDVNRFEQLCINYANEKLQQKYVVDNFRLVQDEYEAEGIELFDLSMVDNKDVLELMEGRMGIIMTLNDECLRPNGNDSSFVYKIKTLYRDSPLMIQDKLHRPYEFGVRHFAGSVTYDAQKFIERNNDALPRDLVDCACQCANDLIREEFRSHAAAMNTRGGGGNARNRRSAFSTSNTVAAKFRSQLTRLMSKIEGTRTRYVRCIRPNKEKRPRLTDHRTTMAQLTSAGLVTAITISRETFPDRLDYEVVMERFSCLMPGLEESYVTVRNGVEDLLARALDGFEVELVGGLLRTPYACGKTKVYFRPGALERLEAERRNFYGSHTVAIQRWFRCLYARWSYNMLRNSTIFLQATLHARLARRLYLEQLRAVVNLECWVRSVRAKLRLRHLREDHAALVIQSRWRMRKPKMSMDRWRKSALVLQRWRRNSKNKSNFAASLAKCVEEARKDHQVKALQRNLADVNDRKVPSELKALTKDSEKMLSYYRSELFKVKRKNSEMQNSVSQLDADNKRLAGFQASFDAAITVSNRRIVQLSRSNQALTDEVMGEKHKVAALQRELKNEQMKRDEEIAEMKYKFAQEVVERESETAKVQKELENLQLLQQKRKKRHDREVIKLKKAHAAEVSELEEDLRNTQDVHNEYLSKLMDVLESAHTSRETEALRLTEEFEITLEQKDDEISKLKRDIKALKSVINRMQHRSH